MNIFKDFYGLILGDEDLLDPEHSNQSTENRRNCCDVIGANDHLKPERNESLDEFLEA
jgi:hypothetical protein